MIQTSLFVPIEILISAGRKLCSIHFILRRCWSHLNACRALRDVTVAEIQCCCRGQGSVGSRRDATPMPRHCAAHPLLGYAALGHWRSGRRDDYRSCKSSLVAVTVSLSLFIPVMQSLVTLYSCRKILSTC